ncbi:MAG TPA: hypothetical protein VK806_06970 [Bacteroidia bacterium]|jgi:hypothetical protein|nr:hypothetical protein [Bacteroidia bacterium]
MKTHILRTSLIGCLMGMAITGCNHSSEADRVKDIKDTLSQANQNIQQDSANDQQNYRQQTETMLNQNDARIDQLREDIKSEQPDVRDKYNVELDTLKKRNSELETRLNGYKESDKGAWRKFKYDFNRDVDSVGKSISRFAERNMRKNG